MEETRPPDMSEEPFIPRLEMLRLAFEIEDSTSQRVVHYIDVGSLPAAKKAEYVETLKSNSKDAQGDYWVACSENDRRTEVVVMPGRVTLDKVMVTAEALRKFIEGG